MHLRLEYFAGCRGRDLVSLITNDFIFLLPFLQCISGRYAVGVLRPVLLRLYSEA